MADLSKKLEELTTKYAETSQALLELQQKQAQQQPTQSSSTASEQTESQKIVVLPRERRLKKFSGQRTEGQQSVEDFVEEIRAAMAAREMAKGEKVDFIKSHLEGPAKEEVRLFSKEDRENPDRLLEILLDAFGERRSLPQLLKLFYERKQRDSETLRAFSHSLRELLHRALKVDKKAVVDPDQTLRDQFANSVRDGMLRKELRKFVRKHPSISFLDVREEALRWSEEEEKPSRTTYESANREVACEVDEQTECNSSTATSNPFQQVLDVLLKQQKSIEDMVKAMNNLKTVEQNQRENQHPRNQTSSSRGNCYNCGKPNHIARYCRSRPVAHKPSAQDQTVDKKTEQSQSSNYRPLSRRV